MDNTAPLAGSAETVLPSAGKPEIVSLLVASLVCGCARFLAAKTWKLLGTLLTSHQGGKTAVRYFYLDSFPQYFPHQPDPMQY